MLKKEQIKGSYKKLFGIVENKTRFTPVKSIELSFCYISNVVSKHN